MKNRIAAAVISVCVIVALAWLGVTSYLGAHPVAWPVTIALIGAPLGGIAAILAGLILPSKPQRAILFLVLMFGAWGLAHWGKTTFVASFAEDRLAGQFWYYGWIATCAMATSVLATVAAR